MDLVLDLYKIRVHAQKYMANLGIEYDSCEPFSIGDCWVFYGCRNVPNLLPKGLSKKRGI